MPTQQEIVDIIKRAADRRGIPRKLALACAVGESNLKERAERWGNRTTAARDAIGRGDHAALEGVMQDLEAQGLSADISFGIGQQSWKFAPESDGSYRAANLLQLRELYFDPQHAAARMCALLAGHYRSGEADALFKALCRYNRPAGNGVPANDEVAHNYRRGLEEADRLLAGDAEDSAEGATMGYVFPVQGFRGTVNLHHGVSNGGSDLFAPLGTPVVAMCGGRVDAAAHGSVGGNYVIITGDDGLDYYYAHGDRFPAVAPGSRVSAGTYLFGVGETGNAVGTGPHLHIGIGHGIVNGVGPNGGTGANFDAVGLMRRVLAEQGSGPGGNGTGGTGGGTGVIPETARYRVAGTDGAGLNLREQPSTSASPLELLPEGATVEAQDRAWRPVRDPQGTTGWAAEQFLVADGAGYRVGNTDGAGLNLREQPSTTAAIVARLPEGTVVTAQDRAWRLVRAPDGHSGWVANQFLTPA